MEGVNNRNNAAIEGVSQNNIKVGGSVYYVEPLHNRPRLLDECCELINAEWKRSHIARLRSIEKSSDNFPMSLILLRSSGYKRVVGHCRISKISFSTTKVFVETVIIHPSLRGKGLGKFLMKQVEEVAKKKNIKWIYLSTQGQENFYQKLGYTVCPPIDLYTSELDKSNENIIASQQKQYKAKSEQKVKNDHSQKSISSPPVPPPPPLPVYSNNISTKKTFMKKQIIY